MSYNPTLCEALSRLAHRLRDTEDEKVVLAAARHIAACDCGGDELHKSGGEIAALLSEAAEYLHDIPDDPGVADLCRRIRAVEVPKPRTPE